jgi:hypothetical protein
MSKRYKENEPINPGKFLVDHGAKPKKSAGPYIMRDHYNGPLAYESPLSGKKIDSRSAREKEMKEFNVREVDPSETPFRRSEDRTLKPSTAKKHGVKGKWAK